MQLAQLIRQLFLPVRGCLQPCAKSSVLSLQSVNRRLMRRRVGVMERPYMLEVCIACVLPRNRCPAVDVLRTDSVLVPSRRAEAALRLMFVLREGGVGASSCWLPLDSLCDSLVSRLEIRLCSVAFAMRSWLQDLSDNQYQRSDSRRNISTDSIRAWFSFVFLRCSPALDFSQALSFCLKICSSFSRMRRCLSHSSQASAST